jgi:hypothetical protein
MEGIRNVLVVDAQGQPGLRHRLVTGSPPHFHLTTERLTFAKSMSTSGGFSLLDVAARTGFQTQPAAFHRRISSLHGDDPADVPPPRPRRDACIGGLRRRIAETRHITWFQAACGANGVYCLLPPRGARALWAVQR